MTDRTVVVQLVNLTDGLTAAEIPAGQLGQWFLPEPAPALVTFSTHPDTIWPGIKSWWFEHGSDEALLSMVDEGA